MSLAARLARAVTGDVLFDAGSRGRYATDASIYEVKPVGVLVPKTIDDVRAAIAIVGSERVLRCRAAPAAVRADGRRGARDRSQQAFVRDHGVRSRRDDRRCRARCGALTLNAWLKPQFVVSVDVSTSAQAISEAWRAITRAARPDRLRQHGA
jgi:hypothetical protein